LIGFYDIQLANVLRIRHSYIIAQEVKIMYFSSLHDPQNKKYAIYYSTVLITVIITVICINMHLIHLTIVESAAVFFEGFFSLFMLARHKETELFFMSKNIHIALKKN